MGVSMEVLLRVHCRGPEQWNWVFEFCTMRKLVKIKFPGGYIGCRLQLICVFVTRCSIGSTVLLSCSTLIDRRSQSVLDH